jgi:hypothetical protein
MCIFFVVVLSGTPCNIIKLAAKTCYYCSLLTTCSSGAIRIAFSANATVILQSGTFGTLARHVLADAALKNRSG